MRRLSLAVLSVATLAPAYLDRMGSDVKKQDAKDDMDDTKKKVNEFLDRAEGHARDAEKSIKAYDGKLEERKVRAGLANWEFTEIIEGLAEGERIVTSLEREGVKVGARATAVEPKNGK